MKTIQTKPNIKIIYYPTFWQKILIRLGIIKDKRFEGKKHNRFNHDEFGQLPKDYVDMSKNKIIK